jgi:hypothetical protein
MKNTSLRLMIALGIIISLLTSGIRANTVLSSSIPNIHAQWGVPGTNPSRVVSVIPGEGYFIRQSGESIMMHGNLSDPLGMEILQALAKPSQEGTPNTVSAPTNEIIVTNSSDSGVGSLRWAIEQANTNPGPDVIHFSMSSSTIILTSLLPVITDNNTVIDASQNWNGSWPTGKPGIAIDGGSIGVYSWGLQVFGAQNVTLKGLEIENFNVCIYIQNASFTNIGEGASTNGGGRMLIHGCNGPAITILGGHDNKVVGSYIGTSNAGNLPVPNLGDGIEIINSARNAIGGEGGLEGNIIGASDYGISIIGSGSISNTVSANQIGVGMLNGDIANLHDGVYIGDGATFNAIGGRIEVIPGHMQVYTCMDNNHVNGVEVTNQAMSSFIACNIIVSNDQSGIFVHQTNTKDHWIFGNFVGTDRDYASGLGNSLHGIGLYEGTSDNLVNNNFIGNNGWSGIAIVGVDTNKNWLLENHIGIGMSGEALGNAYYGVDIMSSHDNTLTRNVITKNGSAGSFAGVHIGEDTAVGNALYMNSIYENAGLGIQLTNRSQHEIGAPVINAVDCPVVSGIAGPIGARVDIFSDNSDEGRYFEGSATVDDQYHWTYRGRFRGPNLTAIVIDNLNHDASEFSAPWVGAGECYLYYLPNVARH